MPTRSSRNVTREVQRRREESPVVALEDDRPKRKCRPKRSWDEFYQALVEYKKQHGSCNVSQYDKEDPTLGWWVCHQRSNRYCSKKLTLEQRDRLSKLGFDWETKEEREERFWNELFERLKAYRREYLDCCVPKGFKEDPSLALWVATQRKLYKRSKILLHRKEKLESVRFTWSLRDPIKQSNNVLNDEKWSVQYDALVSFCEAHGHCIVPNNYKQDKSLGKWVSRQRNINQEERMPSDRFQLLEDIDFVWEVDSGDPEASLTQRQWDEMYQHLVEFKENNGHPNPPSTFPTYGLGNWVVKQRMEGRKGFLDHRRAKKLNAIGLTWDKDYADERWDENFERLLAFKRKHGHCKVEGKDGKLGRWVDKQRTVYKKCTLKPEREARLEAVGFLWKIRDRAQPHAHASRNQAVVDETHRSDQARGSRRSTIRPDRKPAAIDCREEKDETDKCESSKVEPAFGDHVKVGTRLSVLWGDGNYRGGELRKMRPDSCFVEYYDGDEGWLDHGAELFSIVYPMGTQVYKNFPGRGFYWGEITASKHDNDSLYYEVEYSDGDLGTDY
jgi:hypothetical protein